MASIARSDFDDFRIDWIATARLIYENILQRTKWTKSSGKVLRCHPCRRHRRSFSGRYKSQKPKKHLNQTFWGNFVDRKLGGNFGQWGIQKKFRCSGFAVSFFHYGGGGMPPIIKKWDCKPWAPKLFLDPPLAKISPKFSVYKISQKGLF